MPDVKIKEEKIMIINSNIAANNTIRQLGINQAATQSSLEKLSSGLRINSAADDPAGLTISEQMRGQISGLNQATTNAQTGVSLVSTAEGALNTTTSILQSMRSLAVQAANTSNTTTDTAALQTEFSQLSSAIDDIGNQTQFNTKNLLDGSMAGASGVSVGQNNTTGAVVSTLKAATVTASASMAGTGTGTFTQETLNIDGTNINVNWQNLSNADQSTITTGLTTGSTLAEQNDAMNLMVNTINSAIDQSGTGVAHVSGYVSGASAAADKMSIESGSTGINSKILTTETTGIIGKALGTAGTTGATGTDNYSGPAMTTANTYNVTINGVQMQVTPTSAITTGTTTMANLATDVQTNVNTAITTYNTNAGLSKGQAGYINAVTVNASTDGRLQVLSQSGAVSFSDSPGNTFTTNLGLNSANSSSSNGGGLTFQIGANAGQTMSVSIGDMRSSALGLSGLDLTTVAGASNAITAIDKATAMVTAQRSQLGAAQNRLQDTITNLGTSSQNVTSAEANIRDVDMATEMTNFQKNNVLSQAAQSMLAQANQLPQGVLKLLQ